MSKPFMSEEINNIFVPVMAMERSDQIIQYIILINHLTKGGINTMGKVIVTGKYEPCELHVLLRERLGLKHPDLFDHHYPLLFMQQWPLSHGEIQDKFKAMVYQVMKDLT